MLIFKPDFARRIDLPGAGPCPRPVDIDRGKTGFANLVSLRVYSFAGGMVIDGEAEEDEVYIVVLRGAADVAVDSAGSHVGDFPLRATGGARAVYLPVHAAYRLTARSDCDIAYARSRPMASPLPAADSFTPVGDRLHVSGHATGMDLTLETIAAGESLALAGRGGGAPERFLHVRSDGHGAARIGGDRLGDWESAILNNGEQATLAVEKGTIDILTVRATTH